MDLPKLPNVRKLFIPDPGDVIFDTDLSSADLRIVVWESDCKEMKQMLAAGLDPYTEVAREFYNDPTLSKKDPRRQLFKSFCHGTNYKGSPRGLAERLGLSVQRAEETQAWYFFRFPEIKRWHQRLELQVQSRKEVRNIFGYRWAIQDRIEGTIMNQACAWIPQSTVACLINRIWVRVEQAIPEVQIRLQVHDSLVGTVPAHLAEWAIARVIEEANKVALPYPNDPLVIPLGAKWSRVSWGDCG